MSINYLSIKKFLDDRQPKDIRILYDEVQSIFCRCEDKSVAWREFLLASYINRWFIDEFMEGRDPFTPPKKRGMRKLPISQTCMIWAVAKLYGKANAERCLNLSGAGEPDTKKVSTHYKRVEEVIYVSQLQSDKRCSVYKDIELKNTALAIREHIRVQSKIFEKNGKKLIPSPDWINIELVYDEFDGAITEKIFGIPNLNARKAFSQFGVELTNPNAEFCNKVFVASSLGSAIFSMMLYEFTSYEMKPPPHYKVSGDSIFKGNN